MTIKSNADLALFVTATLGTGRTPIYAGQFRGIDKRTFRRDWVMNSQHDLAICNADTASTDLEGPEWTILTREFSIPEMQALLTERANAPLNTRADALVRGYTTGALPHILCGWGISRSDLNCCTVCHTLHMEKYFVASDIWESVREALTGTVLDFVHAKVCLRCLANLSPRKLRLQDFPSDHPKNSAIHFGHKLPV